jgi:hypothetical protein
MTEEQSAPRGSDGGYQFGIGRRLKQMNRGVQRRESLALLGQVTLNGFNLASQVGAFAA